MICNINAVFTFMLKANSQIKKPKIKVNEKNQYIVDDLCVIPFFFCAGAGVSVG